MLAAACGDLAALDGAVDFSFDRLLAGCGDEAAAFGAVHFQGFVGVVVDEVHAPRLAAAAATVAGVSGFMPAAWAARFIYCHGRWLGHADASLTA